MLAGSTLIASLTLLVDLASRLSLVPALISWVKLCSIDLRGVESSLRTSGAPTGSGLISVRHLSIQKHGCAKSTYWACPILREPRETRQSCQPICVHSVRLGETFVLSKSKRCIIMVVQDRVHWRQLQMCEYQASESLRMRCESLISVRVKFVRCLPPYWYTMR